MSAKKKQLAAIALAGMMTVNTVPAAAAQVQSDLVKPFGYTDAMGLVPQVSKLTMQEEAAITAEPEDIILRPGETAHFSIEATGDGLTYQWYYKLPKDPDFTFWGGRNTAEFDYELTEQKSGMQAYCEVTDSDGNTVKSRILTVRYAQAVTLKSEPEDITMKPGEKIHYEVEAEGDGLTYKWFYKLASQTEFSEWQGRTVPAFNYEAPDDRDGMQVYCQVTDMFGNEVTTRVITLKIELPVSIVKEAEDITIQSGETCTFFVETKGTVLQYQWFVLLPGESEWHEWTGRTNPSFEYQPADNKNGMQVYCQVTGKDGEVVKSRVITLTIEIPEVIVEIDPPTITQEPEDVTIQAGEKAYFSVAADGTKLKYQWYYQLPGQKEFIPMKWKMFPNLSYNSENLFMTLLGKLNPDVQYTTAESKDGTQIYCVITDAQGNTVTSRTVTLHVEPRPIVPGPEESSQEESVEESSEESIEESSEESSEESIEESSEESSEESIEESSEESSEVIEESSEESSEVIEESSEESSEESIEESSEESSEESIEESSEESSEESIEESSEESSEESIEESSEESDNVPSKHHVTEIDLDQEKMREIIPAIPSSAPAESGKCGKGTRWSYYADEALLVISGAGSIGSASESSFPEEVKHVVVKSGIIKIEDQAFAGLQDLKSIDLPTTVSSIGSYIIDGDANLFAIFYEGSLSRWNQNVKKPAAERWDRLVDETKEDTGYHNYFVICKDKALVVEN